VTLSCTMLIVLYYCVDEIYNVKLLRLLRRWRRQWRAWRQRQPRRHWRSRPLEARRQHRLQPLRQLRNSLYPNVLGANLHQRNRIHSRTSARRRYCSPPLHQRNLLPSQHDDSGGRGGVDDGSRDDGDGGEAGSNNNSVQSM